MSPGTALSGGPSRATQRGPRLGRIRFCTHLGAGVRVGATAEGSLVGEAAGRGLWFCHGRTAVSRTTAPGMQEIPTLRRLRSALHQRRRDCARGAGAADFQPIACWKGSWLSADRVPVPPPTALYAEDYNSQGALRTMESCVWIKKKKKSNPNRPEKSAVSLCRLMT